MMLLIAFYAAVLFITAWTLSAVFAASPQRSTVIAQPSSIPGPQSPVAGRQ